MPNKNIINLEGIVPLEIVRRPSKIIKSPYVSDAVDEEGAHHLVHTPGLGLADQCLPGSKVFATPSKSKNSKTDFIIQSVLVKEQGYSRTIIGANPHTAEIIGKSILKQKLWNPYPRFKICDSKPPHIDYVGDIYLNHKEEYIIIELKNVICASYDPNLEEIDRRYIYFDHTVPFKRSGIYPNGEKKQEYKGQSVVSQRSLRQIDHMIRDKKNYRYVIVFLVNRGDCHLFKPKWQKDIVYSKKLAEAFKNGIEMHALSVTCNESSVDFERELDIDLQHW